MEPFNIVIIEDNNDLRLSLQAYFHASKRINCVMAVDTVDKFLKFHGAFMGVQMVLLDVMLYNQSSIYSIPHIQQEVPDAEIIMFTIMDDSTTIFQALTYGATGYLIKDIPFEEIEQSLLTVLEGKGALISPAVARKIVHHFQEKKVATSQEALTDKEATVATLLNEGRSYEEIAARLGITLNGVRYHVKNIYKRLNVNSRGELLRVLPKGPPTAE